QEVAKVLSTVYEVQLIYSFEKAGVLLDINDESTLIKQLNWEYYQQLKNPDSPSGVGSKIFAGMIPKLDNAFAALNSGVKKVIIGKAENLLELINGTSGTSIVNE
ncbi:MAG: acetylglutamate kinase, partial [Sphingobacteriales bacterium]|nr:acetylglutamate kinase [Sphingobacteriales bacterium]